MSLKKIILSAAIVISAKGISQNKVTNDKTEVLIYESATFDPASEETQIQFKTSGNEKRIFYYSKQDELKLEEFFFNKPVIPPLSSNLSLTKLDLVGTKYKITYYGLTEMETTECCFKMRQYQAIK